MTVTSGQGEDHWKKKYYDQLDQLETKEKEWRDLESILKKTVGRLSLASEGQNAAVDQYVSDIRASIKNDIDAIKLESILEGLSKVLAKLEQSQAEPNRQIIQALKVLSEAIELPEFCEKSKQKLIKRLATATDEDKDSCISDLVKIIKSGLSEGSAGKVKKTGFLERLMGSEENSSSAVDVRATSSILVQVLKLVPWPVDLKDKAKSVISEIQQLKTDKSLSDQIDRLDKLFNVWQVKNRAASLNNENSHLDSNESDLEIYRTCIMSFFDKVDDLSPAKDDLSALRILAKDATTRNELNKLSADLAQKLVQTEKVNISVDSGIAQLSVPDADLQPSIPELLIRLLEQLVVPIEFHKQMQDIKLRLEKPSHDANWKRLLKDVALLINSIRVRMQSEKHEFESFLQQVTSRLKEMDVFLQNESSSLETAEQAGKLFDVKVNGHVKEIHDDINQSEDLSDLKSVVENSLENISKHIKDYRQAEKKRYTTAKKDLFDMQNQMMSLEKETDDLKTIIVETNKQAMFDVLTEIPNRLAYEKKAVEEIARWKRFSNPLSLAIWDIDLFKKVNDTYGHKAGDKVLKTIAQLLNGRIRETDFLARFGGEEFVMFLPGTNEDEALKLVNNLRKKVEECGFHYQGENVGITVSCGVSSFRDNDTLEKTFERADNALYQAKDNGRNQCIIAPFNIK